jgi:hypothetical protein
MDDWQMRNKKKKLIALPNPDTRSRNMDVGADTAAIKKYYRRKKSLELLCSIYGPNIT